MARIKRRSLALSLFLLAGGALAQTSIDIEADFSPGTHKRFAERVNQGQTSIYAEVLAAYDARLAKHPDDVNSSIERCRFIETFAYSEDMVIESASDDLDECREQLASGPHAKDIDVVLYGVESAWEEDEKKAAQALIPQSRQWTRRQQATLFELLCDKFRWDDAELAGQYAMQAVGLNPGSRVLMTAVERYVQLGAKDKARRILVDAPASTWEQVPRFSAAKLLIELGDPKAAAALLKDGEKDGVDGGNVMLARILADTGEIQAARGLYRAAIDKNKFVSHDVVVEYFEFERQHGSREEAIAAYRQLRDQGLGADILGRERLALFLAHPGAPWQWRDIPGFLLLLCLLLVFAAAPLLTIAPIHYRGLARRVAGLAPDKAEPKWTLRHSWYALGVVWLGGAVALYVFTAGALEILMPWTKRLQATTTDIVLGKQLLFVTLLGLLLVLPLFRGRPVRSILLGRWSITRSILVGIGAAIALKILAAVAGIALQSVGALGNDTTRAMQGAHQTYGLAVMLLVVAVAVPFVEELVFRGVMLEAFRGQVTFLFATVVQAASFAASHESWVDMPVLFVFGLLAGWLAKRSEGLLAPMAMHATFNLTSALAIVGITSVLNR